MMAHLGQAAGFLGLALVYTFIAWRIAKSGRWSNRRK